MKGVGTMVAEVEYDYELLLSKCIEKDKFIQQVGRVLMACRCGVVTMSLVRELSFLESGLESQNYVQLLASLNHKLGSDHAKINHAHTVPIASKRNIENHSTFWDLSTCPVDTAPSEHFIKTTNMRSDAQFVNHQPYERQHITENEQLLDETMHIHLGNLSADDTYKRQTQRGNSTASREFRPNTTESIDYHIYNTQIPLHVNCVSEPNNELLKHCDILRNSELFVEPSNPGDGSLHNVKPNRRVRFAEDCHQYLDQHSTTRQQSGAEHALCINQENTSHVSPQMFPQFSYENYVALSGDTHRQISATVPSHEISMDTVPDVQHASDYEEHEETEAANRNENCKPASQATKTKKPGKLGTSSSQLICNDCGKSFAKLSKLNEHVRTHTGEKPFKCTICKKCFAQSGTLKYHMRIHSGERPFTCSACGKTFAQPGQLNTHQLIHREKSYKCQLCKKSFPEESQLDRHVKIHKKERPYKCATCGKRFLHQGNLEIHQQKCTVVDNFLTCKECGVVLPSVDEVKTHDMMHSKSKPFRCEVCCKRFTSSMRLSKHQSVHTDTRKESSHMCDVCGQCYEKASHLKVHLRVHSGEKPYMCDLCGKFLGSSNNLRRHLLSHTGERNFKCDICEKDFSTAHNLEYHSRVHSGLKPFKCSICGKCFAFSFSLDRHMRIHNKGQTNAHS